jgi:hypothetical protein
MFLSYIFFDQAYHDKLIEFGLKSISIFRDLFCSNSDKEKVATRNRPDLNPRWKNLS